VVQQVAQLHSLVDLLKKNLYFAEGLSLKELTRSVHTKMLQDYSSEEVEKFIVSCLSSTKCFYSSHDYLWYMDKKGLSENDEFYNKLFKEQMALRFSDVKNKGNKSSKASKGKRKKNNNKVIQLSMNLVCDGRFVQHEGGKWGLTEWEVDPNQYRLRHLVIKVLANNPEGLNLKEIVEKVGIWRETSSHVIKELLRKYHYFLLEGEIWSYNAKLRSMHDQMIEKHIASLRRQKLVFFQEKASLVRSLERKNMVLKELQFAKEQTAAALAEQTRLVEDYDHIVQRFAEKDLLLSLRKRELIKCKQEKQKMESKANCILRECRKWVDKCKNLEQENDWLIREAKVYKDEKEKIAINEEQLRKKIAELKDKHASEKADLIRENINLKHQLEKHVSRAKKQEKDLKTEISRLGADLRTALQESEERRYLLEMAENQLNQLRKELRQIKKSMTNPLVKLSLKVANIFAR